MAQEPRPTEERRWAFFGHISLLISLIPLLAFLGPIIAFFFVYRRANRRSQHWVAFQGLQAAFFQIPVVFIYLFIPQGAWVVVIRDNLVSVVRLIVIAGWAYAVWGAFDCLLGHNFKYLLVGQLTEAVFRRVRR